MDDRDWTSESSVDSDALSPLPPLVIWTSRRSAACPPPQNVKSFRTPYTCTAHHHAHAVSGNQVATSDASFAYYAQQHTSISPWKTPSFTAELPSDHASLGIRDQFGDSRPVCQRNEDTHTIDMSTTAVEISCSNPMISAMDLDERSQDSGNQTVNYPVSVSDHYAGLEHVPINSEKGNFPNKSAEVDHHSIGHVPVSPLAPRVSAKHHDRQKLNYQHISESCSEEDSQLLHDFPQDHTSLIKETGVSLDRQHDIRDRAHSQSGEEPQKCKHCDKSFSAQSCLISHERTHPEEKPFKCKVCDKTFNKRYSLVCHGRVHSGEKPFLCTYCAKSFSQKSSCTAHERIHTGKRPFKCDHCDQGFSKSYALRVHKFTHTGEKPFKCKRCDKSYRQSAHLINHQRIHTGERPYKFTECGKAFTRMLNLTAHQSFHTGEKPFSCRECGRSFTTKSSLTRHERIHH
ncbi:zinc finger and SCAN domain-containing protein 2-like [Sycon ciliatum]|uniref:zinc finger and SCAN domain-containing protein 2-like n=1 Tax=Sycon ciliatum TaxID=27933 RepID=UPI0031F68013